MKKIVLFIQVLCFVSLHQAVKANPVQEVSDLLSRYSSFSGVFEQTLISDKGESIQNSSGEFKIQRPGLFRWETFNPFAQLLVSDLETLWLFDPDLEQVTIRPFANQASQSPALLLSGNAEDIAIHYDVAVIDSSKHFQLTPKEESTFTKMELVFDQQTLQKIIVMDSLAQTTTFTFSKIKTGQAFSQSTFTFDVPEGVDILIDE